MDKNLPINLNPEGFAPLTAGSSAPVDDPLGLFAVGEGGFTPKLTPMEAGWNASQGLMWRGIEASAEAAGIDTPEFVANAIEENEELAASAPLEDLWDKLQFAVGQLGPLGAATVPAALLGSAAATTTGLTASWLMTQGDLQSKAKELDPEAQATWRQLAYGTAFTAPDIFAISKAKSLLLPMKELIKDQTMDSLKNMTKTQVASKFVKDAGKVGMLEGVQDFGTGVGANIFTDTPIDQSRIQALANSAGEEALIGGILGLPLSGANLATANVADRQRLYNAERVADIVEFERLNKEAIAESEGGLNNVLDRRDFQGNFNELAVTNVPMPYADKNPGFFSLAFATVTGNVSDPFKLRNNTNKNAMSFAQNFSITPAERLPGNTTINEDSVTWTGEIAWDIGQDYFKATEQERNDAAMRKAAGEADLSNPIDRALREMLHGDRLHQLIIERSRGEINPLDSESLFSDETYLPWGDVISWERVTKDPKALEKLIEGMKKEGKTNAQIEKTKSIVNQKQEQYLINGNTLHRGEAINEAYKRALTDALKEGLEGEGVDGKMKGLITRLKNVDKDGKTRESALTLDRALKDAPQSWINSYADPKTNYGELIYGHVQKNMEHLALIDRFGVELEGVHEAIARSLVEGEQIGKPLTPRDIDSMYDIVRTQQRVHLKPVDKKWRDRQQKVKSAININLLGLSALVSIPEALTIPMNTDIRTAIKGLGATMRFNEGKHFNQLTDKEQARVLLAAGDLNLSLNTATQHSANRLNQETANMPKWEQNYIRYFTGLPYMQHFLSVWAGKSMDLKYQNLISMTNDPRTSVDTRNQARIELYQAGIDHEQATTWQGSGFDKDSQWYTEEYLPSILSQVRDTIVDPEPVDKPAWQNNEHLQLISQLKGFMTVFTNRVMRGQKQKIDMMGPGGNRELATKIAPYLTAYLVGQMGIGSLRELLKSGEVDDEKTLAQRGWNAFGYVGSVAYFVDPVNAMLWRSEALASVGGPALSITNQIVGDAVRAIEAQDPEQFANKLLSRAVPNSPFKDVLLEAIGVE